MPFQCCVNQYANVPALDFDSAESEKPTQVMDLIDSKDAVEYPVPYDGSSLALRAETSAHTETACSSPRAARYPAVSILTLFFNQNAGGDQTQIFYLGFKGEFAKVSSDLVLC